MKKCLLTLLILALVLGGTALAVDPGDTLTVCNCNEYITLRARPDTKAAELDRIPLYAQVTYVGPAANGFYQVIYNRKTGYALSKYLTGGTASYGGTVSLSSGEYYNVNLFLSNFSELCWGWTWNYRDGYASDADLVDFAIDHIWFNQQDKLEWGEWGDYNVRLSDKYISKVTKKYFGRTPKDLSRTRFDYYRGYYYWQETGGHTDDGFTILDSVESLGGGRYGVWFNVVSVGEEWSNDICRASLSQALRRFDSARINFTGYAVIDCGSGSLSDRSTWRLLQWTISSTDN